MTRFGKLLRSLSPRPASDRGLQWTYVTLAGNGCLRVQGPGVDIGGVNIHVVNAAGMVDHLAMTRFREENCYER